MPRSQRIPQLTSAGLPQIAVRHITLLGLWSLMGLGSVGCANDTTGPTPTDAAHLYYQLTLNADAITMALTPPFDTLQLIVTPLSATGAAIADSGVTTWTSSDSTSVRVSPTGLLTALAVTSGVTVTVQRTIGTITQKMEAVVNVNDTTSVPRVARLTMQPNLNLFGLPYYDLGGFIEFVPTALDASGQIIPQVVFTEHSSNPTSFTCVNDYPFCHWNGEASNYFVRQSVGRTYIVAEATVYGVHRVDSLPFTVGWLNQVIVQIQPHYPAGSSTPIGIFNPTDDTVAVGGAVLWENQLPGQLVDVVFDDSSAVQSVDSATFLGGFASVIKVVFPAQGGGNIRAFAPLDTGALRGEDTLGIRARRFPTAGTYRYHSALYGTSGVIHVLSNSIIK